MREQIIHTLLTSSSSSTTHGAQSLLPKLIAPRMGTESLNPLFPSCLYDTFVASMLACSSAGISAILNVGLVLIGLGLGESLEKREEVVRRPIELLARLIAYKGEARSARAICM